jgi:site-specific DNA recombinase
VIHSSVVKGAVAYCRVSTKEQASTNNSLPVQESKFQSFCVTNHLTPLVPPFVDKQSARTADERPEFQKMLAYCRKNKRKVSCVVVADISRLARNVVDQGTTIAELKKLGIQLVSIDEPIIDDTSAGKLAANLLASFNQFFSDSLSEKTKFRMQAGVKQGRWLWVAPIGYKNESKTIVLDSERAPLVRKAFDLLNDGSAIGDVIRQITALGLTTKKGRHLPKQTFSRMVRNPFYAGFIQQNGTRVKGVHEALVSETLFDSVQQRLQGHVPHEIQRDDFPLRGFIRCAKCGKNLTAGWVTGRNKKYARYWCWTPRCRDVAVRAEFLESQFGNLLKLIQPEARLLAMLPTLAARSWETRKERIALDSKSLVTRLNDQNTLNQRTIKAKLLGELNEDDFRTMKASIETETQRIQEQIKALDAERSTMEELVQQTEQEIINFGKSWKAALPDRKREIQNALFPEGVAFDSNLYYFCPPNHSLIQLLNDTLETFGIVGVPDGI